MRLLDAVEEGLLASVAVVSMLSYSLDILPPPFNSLLFGGGAGLLTATALSARGKLHKADPLGEVGALPGVPADGETKAKEPARRSAEKEVLLKRYDRAFAEMLSRHGPGSRSETIQKMKPLLYQLSPDIKAWSGDMRLRVYLLMQEIAKDLNDPTYARASLGLLVLILSKGGAPAVEMATPIFREKILEMNKAPAYENERFLPRLLLMLDDYDPAKVESLVKEAIHVWGDEKFRAASGYLGLDELKARGMRSSIRGLIGGEIARAGWEIDRTALNRAVELYHEVS